MGLIVWLPLNGNLNNYGTSNVTVTNNGATVNDSGKIGKCYRFENYPKYITLNKKCCDFFNDGDSFSYCCWIKISAYATSSSGSGSGGCVLYYTQTTTVNGVTVNGGGFGILINTTGFATAFANPSGGSFGVGIDTIPLNIWTHICMTYDKNSKKLSTYMNGIFKNSNITNSNWSTNAKAFIFGTGSQGGWNVNSDNYQNDIRIYDHCLSPKEVHDISLGLVLHYPLNDPNNDSNPNLVPSNYWSGSKSLSLSANTTSYAFINNPTINVQTNTTYYWRIEIRVVSGGENLTSLGIDTNCSGGSYSGNDSAHTVVTVVNPNLSKIKNGEWQTAYCITTVKSDATNPKIFHSIYGVSSTATTVQIEYRNLMLVASSDVTPLRFYKSNIVYDCSGYLNHGTITGNLTISNDTPRYNHSTSVIETGEIKYPFPKLQELTYSFWFKRNRVSYSNREMLMTGWYGLSFELNTNNTLTFKTYLTSGEFNITSTTTFTDTSKWYFITLTRDLSGISKIYVNGVLDKSGTNTNTINYTASTAEIFTYSGSSYQFRGSISDFRIYSTALSDQDIRELYNKAATIDNLGNLHSYEIDEKVIEKQQILKNGLVISNHFIEDNENFKVLNDGSVFLRILHHNNPTSNLFTSNNCWLFKNDNLYSNCIILKNSDWITSFTEFEFLVCEKLESSSTENQFRWKQTSNPALSSTVSGYSVISGSPGNAGGLMNKGTYGCFHNGSTWWCCCGSYTAYSGGIPGFWGVVKSGYLDLYIKIPNNILFGNLADFVKFFKKSIKGNNLIET